MLGDCYSTVSAICAHAARASDRLPPGAVDYSDVYSTVVVRVSLLDHFAPYYIDLLGLDRAAPLSVALSTDVSELSPPTVSVYQADASGASFGVELSLRQYIAGRVSESWPAYWALVAASGVDQGSVDALARSGFDRIDAVSALARASGDVYRATELLLGEYEPPPGDGSAQSLYVDVYRLAVKHVARVSGRCMMCGAPHDVPTIKPTCCARPLCMYRYDELGLGTALAHEVRAHPVLVDFLLSCMAADSEADTDAAQLLLGVPPVSEMAACATESALMERLGRDAYRFVKWVVASNRAYIVELDADRRIPGFGDSVQFMFVSAAPEEEAAFQALVAESGSRLAFHGSSMHSWNSIMRNGLKNMSNTPKMSHGAMFGQGIYLAGNSQLSYRYAPAASGAWSGSESFRENVRCLGVCEMSARNLPVPTNNKIYVVKDEHDVMLRALVVTRGSERYLPAVSADKIADTVSAVKKMFYL